MVIKMVVVNDGREYDCIIIDDDIHYTPHKRWTDSTDDQLQKKGQCIRKRD